MRQGKIKGKTIRQWVNMFPVLGEIIGLSPVFFRNPEISCFTKALESEFGISENDVTEADGYLDRYSSYLAAAFPETLPSKGIIESDLVRINSMKQKVEELSGNRIQGSLFLKKDSHLPVSGSIKARGGFYEVLKHAHTLAVQNGLFKPGNDSSLFHSKKFNDFFSQFSIGVGSTGNLGLSIGIMGKRLGFKVYVHMSSEARQWKKDLLRSIGAVVVEHQSDYSRAVEQGRRQADEDPGMYFVDDENSKNLFIGYAVAGRRLQAQLEKQSIKVDETHPLFVYLPCGVGGGPGGIALGLKQVFKDHVHCFFAEPTHSPCVLLGLVTGLHDGISVQDMGIDNITAADGLAVGRPSKLAGKIIRKIVSGIYTLTDEDLFKLLFLLRESENIYMEPSALASMAGPAKLLHSPEGMMYIKDKGLSSIMDNAVHIVWGTGGGMVPEEIRHEDEKRGKDLLTTEKI